MEKQLTLQEVARILGLNLAQTVRLQQPCRRRGKPLLRAYSLGKGVESIRVAESDLKQFIIELRPIEGSLNIV